MTAAGTDPDSVIAAVLETLREARAALLDPSPRNIDWCRAAVSQSVQKVVSVMEGDRAAWNRDELRCSLLEMRRQLSAITTLLDSAAAFRRNMLKASQRTSPAQVAGIDAAFMETARRVHVLG